MSRMFTPNSQRRQADTPIRPDLLTRRTGGGINGWNEIRVVNLLALHVEPMRVKLADTRAFCYVCNFFRHTPLTAHYPPAFPSPAACLPSFLLPLMPSQSHVVPSYTLSRSLIIALPLSLPSSHVSFPFLFSITLPRPQQRPFTCQRLHFSPRPLSLPDPCPLSSTFFNPNLATQLPLRQTKAP